MIAYRTFIAFLKALYLQLLARTNLKKNYTLMHKNYLRTTLWSLLLPSLSAYAGEPQDVTNKLKNPGFEEGFTGWISQGFQLQNNDSPSTQGWEKEGTFYAEKWTASPSTLSDATLTQTVGELAAGSYTLKVYALACNESGTPDELKGADFFAGDHNVTVKAGGEYSVTTVVTDGKLPIGFRLTSTNANWVACDHFRLYYNGKDDIALFYQEAERLKAQAAKALVAADCHNTAQLQNAINYADQAEDTALEWLLAITNLQKALTEYRRLAAEYPPFRRACLNARKLYAETDYPGRSRFGLVVTQMAALMDKPTNKNLMTAIEELDEATREYLNSRPSNRLTIRNGALWTDNRGKVVQAHGAGFLQVGDTWYMIGEDRSNTWNPDVNMYSTKDFVTWKFERKIIRNGTTHPDLGSSRFIERPKLMYCKNTGKYVVWCHWESSNYGASEAAVFYCDSVNGNYKFHWAGRPLGVKSRDCNVFVDNDGTAYFISTIEENQHLGLFRLSDDYLNAVEYTELFKWQGREAPAIVRKDDTYFMMFSACSGWAPNKASYSYSKSLTSGWSSRIDIGNNIAYDTQAASILTLTGSKGTSYVYVGDRWQDPDLPNSKTILFPITINGTSISFQYKPRFDMDLPTGQCYTSSSSHLLTKEQWSILACSSQETSAEDGAAANAIDGNTETKWHTRYNGSTASAPHYLEIDLGSEQQLAGFLCTPRNDGSENGLIRKYLFLTSADGKQWTAASGGTWLPYWSEVYFAPVKARYVRLVATEGEFASLAELDLLSSAPEFTPTRLSGTWKSGTMSTSTHNLTLREAGNVQFNVHTNATNGTWAFYGPRGQMMHTNSFAISSLTLADAGFYSFVFTDQFNRSSTLNFRLTMRASSTGIKKPDTSESEVYRKEYFTLSGTRISSPTQTGLYIVKTYFSDGSSTTSTEMFVHQPLLEKP